MKQDRPGGVSTRMARLGYPVAGVALLALGVIGAFLPMMPTTIFVILAAGCFARSNRRVEGRLLNHKRFGPTIKAWFSLPALRLVAGCGSAQANYAPAFQSRRRTSGRN